MTLSVLLLAGCGGQGEEEGADNQAEAQAAQNAAIAIGETPATDIATAPSDAAANSSSGGKGPAAGELPKVAAASEPAKPPAGDGGACAMQGRERLRVSPMHALGTEPFWSARVDGRCVTYSHPEDQKGTRIWAQYTPARGGGTWSGTLAGRRFELKIRPQPGCSDGMSDKRYAFAAELTV
ncbi:MAG TPA: hypothetical protein VGB65_10915, partial [Allosphingosinicella sp.]